MKYIQLTNNTYTIIDDQDSDLCNYSWRTVKGLYTQYAETSYVYKDKKRVLRLHQVILERILGRPLTKGEKVDHINRNGLDNRRENLRLATTSQNAINRPKQMNNTSGFKGVCIQKMMNGKITYWKSQIQTKSKLLHLGLFKYTEEGKTEAAKMYDRAALYFFGEYAMLNFPDLKKEYEHELKYFKCKWMD